MAVIHSLGYPRIGANRELKFALEKFWREEITEEDLFRTGSELRQQQWRGQAELDWVPIGDFSFYDQILDMSITLGNLPSRASHLPGSDLQRYFRVARGRANKNDPHSIAPGEMTKWFDTNYHYIVPEFENDTAFKLNPSRLLTQLLEARRVKFNAKPVIIGPLTYLWLGKHKDNGNKLALLPKLLPVYSQLLDMLAEEGVSWVQIDEPILVCDLDNNWKQHFITAYQTLEACLPKLLLTTYFGALRDNLEMVCQLPVQGIHLDAVNARDEVEKVLRYLPQNRILSLGVINGRNIWKTDLQATLDWLQPIYQRLGERLWLAPSCSLLHVPVELRIEEKLDDDIKSWLAFAVQKINELETLAQALKVGRAAVSDKLKANTDALASRRSSNRVHKCAVKKAVENIDSTFTTRQSSYSSRRLVQNQNLALPLFPTTTIGSFPQTASIRQTRMQYRKGELQEQVYKERMREEIAQVVHEQEILDLDVLVHGEAERNDMVEYFGEQLDGFAFSQFGWVQSYGSRCVKPPILFGDVSRPNAMTVEWITYAQTLTTKHMKGMLTGPVTILNWSFVRDDQSRSQTCFQIALAIREEVLDLEKAGVKIIQIDEAALREGLPLRKSERQDYLRWAIEAFRIAANGVQDQTQIHTHMCYSEFGDIIKSIVAMDADVITIETSRSDMKLLAEFNEFQYPNDIGPGVYDIHSPNTPTVEQIVKLMTIAAKNIPTKRLWINPDCGLKTRDWDEVKPALKNMVAAAKQLRDK